MGMGAAIRSFEPRLEQVRDARQFAAIFVSEAGCDPLCSDAVRLIVGELAANAVVHAQGPFTVSIDIGRRRILIEVADGSPGVPSPPPVGDRITDGRGLLIVGNIAQSWGVRAAPGQGKTVWAEISTT
jgi:anti-sigma regulatory factor (Ser/Thr protein kinase)